MDIAGLFTQPLVSSHLAIPSTPRPSASGDQQMLLRDAPALSHLLCVLCHTPEEVYERCTHTQSSVGGM